MSQQIQKVKCQTVDLLQTEWTLWFSFSCGTQNDINYGNNLMKIQKIRTWDQFAILWKWVCKTQNFFIDPQNGSYKRYKFGIEERKIDSINLFKNDIQPQWQYGQNSKYGYFNFGIDRNDQRINEIFESSVLLGVGQSQHIAKNILGVRIVDICSKLKHPSRARLEIWVDFRHDNSQQSFKRLVEYQQKLKKHYKDSIDYEIEQIKFFNISNQEGDYDNVKTPKKKAKGSVKNINSK